MKSSQLKLFVYWNFEFGYYLKFDACDLRFNRSLGVGNDSEFISKI